VAGGPDPDHALAIAGAELAVLVGAAMPAWVVRCVEVRLPGPSADPAVLAEAEDAGRRAGEEVGRRLAELLSDPVDVQRATPLEVVRAAIGYPTAVLRRAGVAPVRRDRVDELRFPDDVYGLVPASLDDIDTALAAPAIAWGAAKAAAHRHRHGPS
jgi:hypothetical protein